MIKDTVRLEQKLIEMKTGANVHEVNTTIYYLRMLSGRGDPCKLPEDLRERRLAHYVRKANEAIEQRDARILKRAFIEAAEIE